MTEIDIYKEALLYACEDIVDIRDIIQKISGVVSVVQTSKDLERHYITQAKLMLDAKRIAQMQKNED